MVPKIVECKCEHKGQDAIYGKGKRLANFATKHKNYRCTVCSAIHNQ